MGPFDTPFCRVLGMPLSDKVCASAWARGRPGGGPHNLHSMEMEARVSRPCNGMFHPCHRMLQGV
jgi:hypothetical protein